MEIDKDKVVNSLLRQIADLSHTIARLSAAVDQQQERIDELEVEATAQRSETITDTPTD